MSETWTESDDCPRCDGTGTIYRRWTRCAGCGEDTEARLVGATLCDACEEAEADRVPSTPAQALDALHATVGDALDDLDPQAILVERGEP